MFFGDKLVTDVVKKDWLHLIGAAEAKNDDGWIRRYFCRRFYYIGRLADGRYRRYAKQADGTTTVKTVRVRCGYLEVAVDQAVDISLETMDGTAVPVSVLHGPLTRHELNKLTHVGDMTATDEPKFVK